MEKELVKVLLREVFDIWRTWRGFRLVALGETGVGKTTLWRYLQTGKTVEASSVSPTGNITQLEKFRLREIKVWGVSTRILAVDVPGDAALRATWKEVLYDKENPPDGVIFMMDHALDATSASGVTYDPKRLEAHFKACRHVRDLILDNDGLRTNLQAFLTLVNKSDLWPESIDYGDLLHASGIEGLYPRLQSETDRCRIRSQACSALYGSNLEASVGWMVKNFTR